MEDGFNFIFFVIYTWYSTLTCIKRSAFAKMMLYINPHHPSYSSLIFRFAWHIYYYINYFLFCITLWLSPFTTCFPPFLFLAVAKTATIVPTVTTTPLLVLVEDDIRQFKFIKGSNNNSIIIPLIYHHKDPLSSLCGIDLEDL